LALAAFVAAGAGPSSAELLLTNVQWQRGRVERARVAAWDDVNQLVDGPPKLDSRLRARLTLKNRGPQAIEGILLRYSMTVRVTSSAGGKEEGVWGIPFMVEEKRVPKVEPNKVLDVNLSTSPALELYLKKLSRAGWWPDRVKLQVMIEPHKGATALQSLENIIEVSQ
jgi:hypothetical protein